MIFSRKLLRFVEFVSTPDGIPVAYSETTVLIEEEVKQGIEEISVFHVDSEEYKRGSENIKTLCEADEKLIKAMAERDKVRLQIIEANKRRMVDWSQMTPTLVRIVAYAGITCVVICLERQTPLSMRWLRALEALLAPKG
jgi:hypothetical protein